MLIVIRIWYLSFRNFTVRRLKPIFTSASSSCVYSLHVAEQACLRICLHACVCKTCASNVKWICAQISTLVK